MSRPGVSNADASASRSEFHTIHWSVVLAAGQRGLLKRSMLWKLCAALIGILCMPTRAVVDMPLTTRKISPRGSSPASWRKTCLLRSGGDKGSFALSCSLVSNIFFQTNETEPDKFKRGGVHETISWDAEEAEQRYRQEPAHLLDPEKIYERRWALTVLEQGLARLKAELQDAGKSQLFDHLQAFVGSEKGVARQAEIAAQLGLSESALEVTVHRLRRRYRKLLRDQIAATVSRPEQADEEIHHLRAILRG